MTVMIAVSAVALMTFGIGIVTSTRKKAPVIFGWALLAIGMAILTFLLVFVSPKSETLPKPPVTETKPKKEQTEGSAILRVFESQGKAVKQLQRRVDSTWEGNRLHRMIQFLERRDRSTTLDAAFVYAERKSVLVVPTFNGEFSTKAGHIEVPITRADDEIIEFLLGCHPEKNPKDCPTDFSLAAK